MKIFLLRKPHLFPVVLIILISIFSIGQTNVYGEEIKPVKKDGEYEENIPSFIDRYHSYFTERIRRPTVWFDSFFGDPRTEEVELPTSFVRFRFAARFTEGDGFEFPLRVRANVKLPRFSRRFRLVVIGNDEEDVEDSQKDEAENPGLETPPNENRSNVGLRYVVYKTLRSKFHFGGGLSLRSPAQYYVRMYYRRLVHIGKDNLIRFTETVFWNSRQGFGEISRVDFEKILAEKLSGRLSFFGTYAEESNGLEWGAEINIFRQICLKSALSFDLGVYGETRPHSIETNYRVATRYRRNIYRPWLFFEIEPGVNFPWTEEDGREAVGYFTVELEVQFTT